MAVTGMANLAVKVADLDAACTFYEETGAEVRDRMHWNGGERADVVLGPDDAPRPEIPGIDGHWHTVGAQQLHLVAAPPRGTAIDSTGNHYCISVADLDGAIAELEAAGIDYVRGVQGDSVVQIWINDP